MANANPLRILFVEDVPSDAILAEREIRKSGLEFSSQRVETKDAMLKALQEFHPDIIVSDYSMPEFDGMQALKLSMEHDSRIPFILLTGSVNEETATDCMKAGAWDYVIKEHMTRLPFAVRDALKQKKIRKARNEAESALRESEERFRTLVTFSPDAIYVHANGVVTLVNPAMCKLLGADQPSQLVGKSAFEIIDPRYHEIVRKRWESLFAGQPAPPIEEKFIRLDGTAVDVEASAVAIDLEEHREVQVVARDITERKRAERLDEALFELSKATYSTDNVNELFRYIHRVLSSILHANNFYIALLTDDGTALTFPYLIDEKDIGLSPAIKVEDSRSLTVEVLKTKKPLLLDETELLDRYATGRNKVWGTAPKCWLGVPLMIRETVIGVMAVQDYHMSGVYGEKDVTLFESAAGQIAIAIERKRAEDALRESECRTRTFLDSTSDMAFLKDDKFRHILANRALCRFYGKTEKEIVRKKDFDLMSEEAALRCRQTDEQAIHSNALAVSEEYIGDRCYESVKFPVAISEGKVGVGGYIRDITERNRAEKELKKSEGKFRAIFDNASDGMFLIDLKDRKFFMCNAACAKMLSHAQEEFSNLDIADIHPGEDLPFIFEQIGKFSRGEEGIRSDIRFKRKDGSIFVADLSPALLTIAEKEYLLIVFQDITERKRAEEKIKVLSEAIDSAYDSFVLVDMNGNVTYANGSAIKSFGYSPEETMKLNIAQFGANPESSAMIVEEMKATGFWNGELICIKKNKDTFPVMLSTSFLIDDKGHPVGMMGVFRDITERKKAEHSLRLSEERFRSVWENSADGMRLIDKEGHIIAANEAYCRLVDVPREKLVHQLFSVVYAKGGPDEDINIYRNRFDSREVVSHLQAAVKLWNGKVLELDISNSFIETEDEARMVLSMFRDVTERKQAERGLLEERNLLRTIIDAIPDEIGVKDTERRFLVVNSGTVRAFQRASADEFIGKKDEDLIPEDLVEDAIEGEKAVLAVGGHSRGWVANKIDPETGEIKRSQQVLKIPLKDHEGKIIGLVSINRDITALKQSEELLEKERTLLMTLIESIPDEVCLKDLRHRYLMANRASMKALGVKSLKSVIGKTDQDFVPEGFAQEHFEEENAILESGEPLINQERIQIDPETGQIERCLLTTKVPVKDNTGKAIGILVVNRNITERKKAEEALRASEEKFRALFEESKDIVYFSTTEGRLLDINPAGIELLGYASKQEMLKIDLTREAYADAKNKSRFDQQMEEQGFVKDFEVVLRRKDREKLTVLETATAVRDKKGKVVQYRGIMRDVTKQRVLEQRFFQAQKMDSIGTLAGGIAHDFNNILGIILGHLALLERTRENAAQFEESIFSINKAVERGASLVRQILTFARKTGVQLETVNINSAVKEIAKMLEETFPKTMTIKLQLDKTIPLVSMDPTQLHQTLLNLCVNARDAMQARGPLSIKTRLVLGRDVSLRFPKAGAGHYVQLSVADTGAGMDEETKRRIFEPFFTTKEQGKGTGLGLAVVYGVLEAHNGFVDVESELGAGTTFDLFFPVPEGILSSSEKPSMSQEDLPRGTETILVVEDEDVLRDLLVKLLEMQGYKVIPASDGDEAVRCFKERAREIDLVLSDMGLPKRSGWDAFKAMRETSKDIRALLASGYLDPGQKSEVLKSGVCGFIQKPYRMEEVLKAVRGALDEKKERLKKKLSRKDTKR